MPTTPSSKATAAAIASITSMNEVCAIDSARTSFSDRTFARGRLGFTAHTASWISLRKVGDPSRSLRMT